MANKRKKKQKQEDFKKTKFKVGKSLPKGLNETNTSFALKKISIPLQDVMKQKELTNIHNKDLKDLLVNVHHYKASSRKEALQGLKSLFEQHPSELQENLNKILVSTVPLMSDLNSDVRLALLDLLEFILTNTTPNEVEPYCLLLVNHLNCAMTQINEDVRLSSLKFLDVLLKYSPDNMKVNYKLVLENLLGLIVNYNEESKNRPKVTVVADGKFASKSSKDKVLQQIFNVLNTIYSEYTHKTVSQSHSTMPFPSDKTLHIAVFDNSAQLPDLSRFHFNVDLTQNIDSSTTISLKSLLEAIIPALVQLWIECLPSSMSTTKEPGSLSSESLAILLTVIRIFKLLFNTTKNNTPVKNWLVATYEKDFKKHILNSFPYQGNVITTKRKTLTSESSQAEMLLTLNVTICEVMTIFLDEKTTEEKAVDDFIIEVLNSQATNIKAELLEGICRYTRQLVATKLYDLNNDSTVKLLRSLLKLYESSHMLSSIKTKLLLLFGEIYEAIQTCVSRNQEIPTPLMTILNNWRNTVPALLAQCSTIEGGNEEFVQMVVCLLSKLTIRFTELGQTQELEPQLVSFIDSGSLSTMSYPTQKAVVDLIFSLPEIGDNLLHSIVMYCHRIDVPPGIVKDIITMIYQRSQACQIFIGFKSIPTSSCYSSLLSIAIGYSSETLTSCQSSVDKQSTFKIHEEDVNTVRKAIQRQGLIIEAFTKVYQYQSRGPYHLEKHLIPALDNILNSYKTLPLPAATSILSIYKCCCDVTDSTQSIQTQKDNQPSSLSSWKADSQNIAKLAMALLEHAVEGKTDLQSSDVKQHIYDIVVDNVKTCPVVGKRLLQILADRIKEKKVFTALGRLIETLSQDTSLSLSSDVAEVLKDLMVKVESHYPVSATFKSQCHFLLHK